VFSYRPSSFAADVDVVGALGIAIVNSDAFAAGAVSIPGPVSDSDWGGWFVWRSFAGHYEFHDASATLLGSWQIEIDSKAMRKIGPNETLVVMVEAQTAGFDCYDGTRHLLKLS